MTATTASEPKAPETQPACEAVWPPGLLMEGFDAISIGKPMRDLGLRAYGHVESGMTFKIKGPGKRRDGLLVRLFDSPKPNNLRLNQLRFTLDRPVDTGKPFDIGGRFDFFYGTDSRFTHALGLLDKQNHDVQPDIVQGYGEMWFKTGEGGQGLDVIFGKWVTTMGAEVIDATGDYLYSRSLLFNYAIPFTHTGLKLSYAFDPTNSIYLAAVRGGDVFKDNNEGVSWMTGFLLSSKEQMGSNPRSQLVFNFMIGPEQAGDGWPGNRVVADAVWTYRWTEKLTQVLNVDYGWQDNVPGALGRRDFPATRDSAWYGLAYYLNYTVNDYLSTTGRFEWFADNHGVRTGYRGNFFEATTGVTITPFPKDHILKNLLLRPELRWDWSANDRPFAEDCQITGAFDVIYKF